VKVLVIDNYDSFTFNLVQLLGTMGVSVVVKTNDAVDLSGIARLAPDGLLISPGPCTPAEAGISVAAIVELAGKLPILGVCLGHQGIGAALGGRIIRAVKVMHGKTSPILHDGKGIFEAIPNPFQATRYHSLVIERSSIPALLSVSAWTAEGDVMGVRRSDLAAKVGLEGVQFHPESILTPEGPALVSRWVALVKRFAAERGN
jgi:anthranilate synthase/aminodeoxychorismate synthase-like glutamine amidotransferase